MKKYVIFSYNITGMGGGQQYTFNKWRFLQKEGFDVFVFSTIEGTFVIKQFEVFERLIIKELRYPPLSFRYKHVKRIINRIIEIINAKEEDEIYIESDGGYETQWAEIVAKNIGKQHIIFSIAEQQNKQYSDMYLDYLYFKYKRNELYGITKDSLALIFKNKYTINDSDKFVFQAVSTNVVDELGEKDDFQFQPSDYNIAGIWRTNKEGFVSTIREIVPFLNEHKDYLFNIIIIGSGSNENEEVAFNIISNVKNARLYILGYIYPIPLTLLRKMDVFVSTSGSTRIPMYYGIPSISVTSAYDSDKGTEKFYPLGIVNFTTSNAVIPEDNGYTLTRLLDMVLFEDYCDTHDSMGLQDTNLNDVSEFKKQLCLFSGNTLEYYDVFRIKAATKNERVFSIVGKIFGHKALFFLNDLVSKK